MHTLVYINHVDGSHSENVAVVKVEPFHSDIQALHIALNLTTNTEDNDWFNNVDDDRIDINYSTHRGARSTSVGDKAVIDRSGNSTSYILFAEGCI